MNLYEKWVAHPEMDATLKKQLLEMNDIEKQDAFYTDLQFGTAGMRGILGPGSNRMNIYVIRKANLGFGKWIASKGKEACKRGVAIAYDNRHFSRVFAEESARVLASLGINAYIFESLRPTPELSFAVRALHCFGGIVITASHNPKEYNGYKVYDENGCQLIPELIDKVIDYVNEVVDPLSITIELSPEDEDRIHWIGKELDESYYEKVLSIQLRPEMKKDIKIVFTPQHGTALEAVKEVYKRAGYPYYLVEEQCSPDPDFTHTVTPNPEDERAYQLAIEYAEKIDADIAIATDPDADRVGVVVRHNGNYQLLSGNQTGAILMEYLFSTMREKDLMPKNPLMFNTIVTLDLGEKVASFYGVETEKTLTGFKFIGDRIAYYEKTKEKDFVFGYEESYGYLIQDFVRDKDAVQACLMIAECSAYYFNQNRTLVDVLESLYHQHGYYRESQVSKSFEGKKGAEEMQAIMERLRKEDIRQVASVSVIAKEDYLEGIRLVDGKETEMKELPSADVLKFYLEDGSWIAIRPSGTEPKCKFYYCIKAETEEEANQKEIQYKEAIGKLLE